MELEQIKNSILEIREKKVILNFELAQMYQKETKRLKESVRRNIRRFPADFIFELTAEEWGNLRSQIATSSFPENDIYLLRLQNTRRGHFIKCFKFRNSDRCQYCNYACLHYDAPIRINLSRTLSKTFGTRKATQSEV